MSVVSRFEADLLLLSASLLEQAPASQAAALATGGRRRPAGISPAAAELVEDMLAKGCVRLLALEGWRPEAFLRDGVSAGGPLWERTAPAELGLTFSRATLDFLLWMASDKVSEAATWKPLAGAKLTTGDLLVLFLAYKSVRGEKQAATWRRRKPFVDHGLCWLAFPEDYADFPSASPNFAPWVTGAGAIVLEAWQRRLAARWIETEALKRRLVGADRVRKLGQAQHKALAGFFAEADRAGRRDLTRFLLLAAKPILDQAATAGDWLARIDVRELSINDRFSVYREAVAPLAGLLVLRRWRRQADSIGYVDEGYPAAQYWKGEWERTGAERLCQAAEAIVRQAEPL